MSGFDFNKQRQDIEYIQEFSGVLGEPMVGLNVIEFGRWSAIADDRTLPVQLTVAEPLGKNMLPGDFVGPDSGRDVVDVAVADEQALLFGVVVQCVREIFGLTRYAARERDRWRVYRGSAAGLRVDLSQDRPCGRRRFGATGRGDPDRRLRGRVQGQQ